MEVLSLHNSEFLKEFTKCGYIYRSSKVDAISNFLLSCLECNAVFCQLESFMDHLSAHLNPCVNNNEEMAENILLEKESHMPCESENLIGNENISENEDGYGKDPLEDEMKNDSLLLNLNVENLGIAKDIPQCLNSEENCNEITENGINQICNDSGEDTCTNNESERHSNLTFTNNNEDETNKFQIKRYMKNRPLISCVIEAFKKQSKLWNTTPGSVSNSVKHQCIKTIAQAVNNQFNINVTEKQMDFIIKRLKRIFTQNCHNTDIENNLYKNQLWFYDELKFIEPHLQLKKQTPLWCSLGDEQILLLIRLLEENECLWNEENIYHTSVTYKQERLKDIFKSFTNIYTDLQDFTINDLKRIFNELKEIIINSKKQKLKCGDKIEPMNRFYSDLQFLESHVGPFLCNDCGKRSLDIYSHKSHISRLQGTRPFKCMVCHKELAHKKGFMCHLQRHTNECPFKCSLCEKSFPSRKEQQRHILKHGSKPYVCELCASTFFTQHQLTNHMKKHANIRDHVCAQCGKGFTHRGLLRQHILTHSKTDCVCSLCDNVYANPRSLRKHYVRVHQSSQDSTYSPSQFCKICKISFATTLEAKWHRKEHRQSLPIKRKHTCDICGHDFAYPRNLADHKKTHSNVRDQVCDVCGKAFTNANILKQHKKVHNAEKFNCKLCGKEYAHYRGLCRHMAKAHKSCVGDLKEDIADSPVVVKS